MNPQANATLGAMVRDAIKASRYAKDVVFARELKIGPARLSRIINGKAPLSSELAAQMDGLLGSKLVSALEAAERQFDLYVSSPITGLGRNLLKQQHEETRSLVWFLRRQGYLVHWPGESITSAQQLKAPDIATEENLIALVSARAFLYMQFEKLAGPSGALIELGIALGKEIKTTVMIKKGLDRPFMLRQGFDAVAARVGGFPDARVYEIESSGHAQTMISQSGRRLFGLDELTDKELENRAREGEVTLFG